MFEQKVTLLPYALRVKTQLATAMPIGATAEDNGGPNTPDSAGRSSRRPKLAVTHSVLKAIEEGIFFLINFFTFFFFLIWAHILRFPSLSSVEQNKQARLDRKRKREDYHEKVEALQARVSSWLSTYGAPEILEVVRKRWLTASLGHLVALLPQPLVVPTCPLEWELGIVYPKQSALMSRLMGYLMPELKNPNPPYESWEPFLRVIAEEEGDTDFAALGIDDRLSLLQKLLIAALDNSEDIQNHLRDLPLESNRGVMLGTDGEGIQYHHFPSFSARRVYKLHPKLLEVPVLFDAKNKQSFVFLPHQKQERQRIKFSKSLSKQASLLTTLPVASPLPNSLAAAAAAAGIPEDLLDRRRSSRLQSPAKGPNDVMSPSTPSATSFDDITESASSIVGTLDEGEDAFQLCCGTVLEMKDLVCTYIFGFESSKISSREKGRNTKIDARPEWVGAADEDSSACSGCDDRGDSPCSRGGRACGRKGRVLCCGLVRPQHARSQLERGACERRLARKSHIRTCVFRVSPVRVILGWRPILLK